MIKSQLFDCSDMDKWKELLQNCGNYDVYHLPEYHLISEGLGEGTPYLFSFEFDGFSALFPFLLRDLSALEGLEALKFNDLTSVYGYPGIVSTTQKGQSNSDEFKDAFQSELKKVLYELSVISLFTRSNPLLSTNWLFEGMADVVPRSTSVAIDLQKSDQEQLRGITKGHKYDIRKSFREGVVVREDPAFEHVDSFISIYSETMDRVGSTDYYYFPKDYYLKLKQGLGDNIKLFCAWLNGQIVSASMFFFADKIVQYHLSGTATNHLRHNGAKVILDHVRTYATENDYQWLNLGGGVGSTEDSLFRFKAGFSKSRHEFEIIRMIVDPVGYEKAVELRRKWAEGEGLLTQRTGFFPTYREPLTRNVV